MSDNSKSKVEIVSVDCPRCRYHHEELTITKFTRPIEIEIDGSTYEVFTYWGMCPRLNEPIIGKEPT